MKFLGTWHHVLPLQAALGGSRGTLSGRTVDGQNGREGTVASVCRVQGSMTGVGVVDQVPGSCVGSMGLVYLPTFTTQLYGFHVGKYTMSHGSYVFFWGVLGCCSFLFGID